MKRKDKFKLENKILNHSMHSQEICRIQHLQHISENQHFKITDTTL